MFPFNEPLTYNVYRISENRVRPARASSFRSIENLKVTIGLRRAREEPISRTRRGAEVA